MNSPRHRPLAFFLGGQDLEMVAIRELLEEVGGVRIYDHGLSWGAKASAYGDAIRVARDEGYIPVLVELEDDVGVAGAIVVDHHGAGSPGASSSLEQVFALLDQPSDRWTRWRALVSANDGGHVRAMRRLGATDDEIHAIRAADRAAQRITEEEERAAAAALRSAETQCGGALLIVRLSHARTAAVTDRLPLEGAPENILIVSPAEVNFFGRREVIDQLQETYGGWSGGVEPGYGYWGTTGVAPEVVAFVVARLGS